MFKNDNDIQKKMYRKQKKLEQKHNRKAKAFITKTLANIFECMLEVSYQTKDFVINIYSFEGNICCFTNSIDQSIMPIKVTKETLEAAARIAEEFNLTCTIDTPKDIRVPFDPDYNDLQLLNVYNFSLNVPLDSEI